MTLGCGGWGGNITSDNISPRHLLNLKRLAWGIRPAVASSPGVSAGVASPPRVPPPAAGLPKAPARPAPSSISAETLAARVDLFLASRGFRPGGSGAVPGPATTAPVTDAPKAGGPAPAETPAAFVCEDDVRVAVREGRHILVGERTIITPAARDAGESARVFRQAGWPGARP